MATNTSIIESLASDFSTDDRRGRVTTTSRTGCAERSAVRLFGVLALLVVVPAARALAQQAPNSADAEPSIARQHRIEEIIVTAQKREQAEIDVPVAMSVLDDRFLGEQAIADLRDVSHYVPNVNIRTSAVLPDIRIRGFGTSPVNSLFEQSVGLNVDGIPYTRKAYFQSALYDVERVEVLRGPQGTLFGKNTTAGLLNVVTKNPSDEYTGGID